MPPESLGIPGFTHCSFSTCRVSRHREQFRWWTSCQNLSESKSKETHWTLTTCDLINMYFSSVAKCLILQWGRKVSVKCLILQWGRKVSVRWSAKDIYKASGVGESCSCFGFLSSLMLLLGTWTYFCLGTWTYFCHWSLGFVPLSAFFHCLFQIFLLWDKPECFLSELWWLFFSVKIATKRAREATRND